MNASETSGRSDAVTDQLCPSCQKRPIVTAYKYPFFRGYVLAWSHGERRSLGCCSCVRKQMLAECAKAVTFGWVSPKALLCTVCCTPVTFARALAVRPKPHKVRELLDELGIPTNQHDLRVNDALYSVAAAMIKADGYAEPSEIDLAAELLARLIPDFQKDALVARVESWKAGAAPGEYLIFLNKFLNAKGRDMLLMLMAGIALADGRADARERKQWITAAITLGWSKADAKARWAQLEAGESAPAADEPEHVAT
ncbi:MAG: TerB family tellurite resistance protein [Phycisphaerales bacterium]|nr:TerB family tellurite resistance protein [Phycisphaerales bacterium]